jgi:hypothetical protein
MKKLVKPLRSEKEVLLVNALCEEFGTCSVETCQTYYIPSCQSMAVCNGQSRDLDSEDDILF